MVLREVRGTGPDMGQGMDPDTGLVVVRMVAVVEEVEAKVVEAEVEVLMVQGMAQALDTVKEVVMVKEVEMEDEAVAVVEEEVEVVAAAVVVEVLVMVVALGMGLVGVGEEIMSPLKLRYGFCF